MYLLFLCAFFFHELDCFDKFHVTTKVDAKIHVDPVQPCSTSKPHLTNTSQPFVINLFNDKHHTHSVHALATSVVSRQDFMVA